MNLAGMGLVEGPEREARAEAVASEACARLRLSDADRARVVRGVVTAVNESPGPEPVLVTVGLSAGDPAKAVAWLRTQGPALSATDATLTALADDVSVRSLPGGMSTTILRWRVEPAGAEGVPPTVPGEAAEWAVQALGHAERALLAERRTRSGTEELLGVVAHSLRNPIGSMASAADLLQLSPGDPATLEAALGILVRSSRAALRLIADLEQLNQIDSGTLHLSPQELRPSHVADSAAEIARPLAQRRSVDLRVEKEPTTRFVVGDVDRLIQAIGNLVVASVEQSPESEAVTLRVRAEDPHVVFEVEDRGPAVPPEAVASFFDRLRKTGPRRRSSSSFGLAAARELIAAHGGKLTVETTPGGSTKFVAHLPGA